MRCLVVAALALVPTGAFAFDPVTDRAAFVALTEGKSLTSMGVNLRVTSDGQIAGRAFGQDVTGTWVWQRGLFCRTLKARVRSYPLNCQVVQRDGTTLRFIADEGKGATADLRIR